MQNILEAQLSQSAAEEKLSDIIDRLAFELGRPVIVDSSDGLLVLLDEESGRTFRVSLRFEEF